MFDTATRDRIRRKLLNHMKEHGIGVHRLAARIEKVSPQKPEIPIKTLQRFLGNSHRTNDMYVRFFGHFTDTLPDADPIGELGRAMAVFHGVQEAGPFGGEYTSDMIRNDTGENASYHSDLKIIADNTFCRVIEQDSGGIPKFYEGVLIGHGTTAIIALQDRSTKTPKQYLIRADDSGFTARGTEAVYGPGNQHVVHSLSGRITLRDGPIEVQVQQVFYKEVVQDPSGSEQPVSVHGEAIREKDDERDDVVDSDFIEVGDAEDAQRAFLIAADQANESELRRLVGEGADINIPDAATGMTALHLSVGRNAIGPVRFLVGLGARFVPDKFGRMPTMMAAECEVSDEVSDFIVEAEGAVEGV